MKMHKKSVRSLVMILVVLIVYLFTNINVYAANPLSQVKKRTFWRWVLWRNGTWEKIRNFSKKYRVRQ